MLKFFSKKLVKQGFPYFFQKKCMIFHLAFTNICNQQCPYCTEGNFSESKIICEPTKKEDILGAIDKIFKAYDESWELGFILVGGEPTMQDCFIDTVNKIKTRKNAYMVLTTNFTKSVEYYKELDIPLITSMHLEFHEPKNWLKKTLQLKDLILETRIMAHPNKMDKVKEAYELFSNASKEHNLSFSVEKIDPVCIEGQNGILLEYIPDYKNEDIEWIKNHLTTRNYNPPSDKLKAKSGFLGSIFYSAVWYYNNGEEKLLQMKENSYKNWYCDRNFIFMYGDGKINYGWNCQGRCHNIFKEDKFPKKELNPIICDKDVCTMNFGMLFPKYKSIKYAPSFHKKSELIKCRLNCIFLKFKVYKKAKILIEKMKKLQRFYQMVEN